ncbi:MAG: terminase small subunit [Mixta calida]|nr:terminase small subunit [Mixta calida]
MALKAKQEKFCQEYLVDLNATQAAIRAGYSAKTARSVGCENLTKPDISARIAELQNEAQQKHGISRESILKELEEARKAALASETVQASAAASATVHKAKLLGLYDSPEDIELKRLEIERRKLEIEKLKREASQGVDDRPITRMEVVIVGQDDKDDANTSSG